MVRFENAAKDLSVVVSHTDTLQKKVFDEELGKQVWDNTYIVDINILKTREEEVNDEGEVEEVSIVFEAEPSALGEIILDSTSYKQAKEKLNEKGYRYEQGLFTTDIVKMLDEQLNLLNWGCMKGDLVSLNHQRLPKERTQVFNAKLDLDNENTKPLMSLLKIGKDSINISIQSTLSDPTESSRAVSINYDSSLVAVGSADTDVYIYQTSDFSLQDTLTEANNRVYEVEFDEQGNYLAAGQNNETFKIYDTSDFSVAQNLSTASTWSNKLEFKHDGSELAVGNAFDRFEVYDTSDWSNITKNTGEDCTGLAYGPNDDYLYVAYEGGVVRIFETDNYDEVTNFSTPERAFSLDVSNNGKYIAVGQENDKVEIYNDSDYSLEKDIGNTGLAVYQVKFTYEDNYLVVASYDNNVYVYDTNDWTRVDTLGDSSGRVRGLAADSNGEYFVSASDDSNGYAYSTVIDSVFLESPGAETLRAKRFADLNYRIKSGSNSGTLELYLNGNVVDTHSISTNQEQSFTTSVEFDRDGEKNTWKGQLVDSNDNVLLSSLEDTFTVDATRVSLTGSSN